ncbi:MAG: FAD-dependent oxidoreductase, partial [Pseudomonadota bacterium]
MSKNRTTVAVVGAGMAGLAAAKRLSAIASLDVKVFEKSRGIGGRLATRRILDDGPMQGIEFDHGAVAMHGDGPLFTEAMGALIGRGTVSPAAKSDGQNTRGFIGQPRMNAGLVPWTEGLNIAFQTRVDQLEKDNGRWQLTFTNETAREPFSCDAAILAVPAPQAMALVQDTDPRIASVIASAQMSPIWTLMLALDRDFAAPAQESSTRLGTESPFKTIIGEHAKEGRQQKPARYVAHATEAWSEANLELSKEIAGEALLEAFLSQTDPNRDSIIFHTAHRWRYALTKTPIGVPTISSQDGSLIVSGDWLLGNDASAAFESGNAAAAQLIEQLSHRFDEMT